MENDIIAYIEANIPELAGRIYATGTTLKAEPVLVISWSPITMDYVSQTQMTAIVIAPDYDAAMAVSAKLKALLGFMRDAPWRIHGSTRFWSSLAGGGTIRNDGAGVYELTHYFIINHKKINTGG